MESQSHDSIVVAQDRNMTMRKPADENIEVMAALAEQNPGPVARLDREGTVLLANPAAQSLFGNGLLTGRSWLALWTSVTREAWQDILERAEPSQIETWLGARCFLLTYRRSAPADCIHVYGAEITDLKRAQAALRRAEEQFRQSQKMEVLGRMAGGIAHDFNNLLTVVLGFSISVLGRLGDPSDVREDIDEIRKAGERAAALVRRLMIFSRQQAVKPRAIDLNQLVQDLNGILYRVVGEDVERAIIAEGGPTWVCVDPAQFEQALMNLVINARDAMPKGGRLEIRTHSHVTPPSESLPQHTEMDPGPWACLSVSDSGVGMTDEVKSHLFEPFYTTKEPGKGTGLGLAMVYGAVTQHGGRIRVQSRPGEGTTVEIYLPLAHAEALPERPTEAPRTAPIGRETILVVEDEPMVRRFVCLLLRGLGYQVMEAGHGQEALLKMEERKEQDIRLVVTDVTMPFMGGIELRKKLREHRPELPVLFVSGYTDKTAMLDSMSNQDAFLQKPFDPNEFAQVVRQLLDAKKTGAGPLP